jgi:hypothetical protein
VYACTQAGNSCCYQGPAASLTSQIDWDLPHQPRFKETNRILDWDPCIQHAGRQQLLLSGTSSKLDKSILIGTLPLT